MKNNNITAKLAFLLISLNLSTSTFAQKAGLERSRPLEIGKEDSVLLVKTWNSFLYSIQTKNYEQIKELSLEKVYCISMGHVLSGLPKKQVMPIDSFIDSVVIKFYEKHFFKVLSDSAYRIIAIMYPDRKVPNYKLLKGQKLILYDVYFIDYVPTETRFKDQNYYIFRFVKRKNQYKFFGLDIQSPHSE